MIKSIKKKWQSWCIFLTCRMWRMLGIADGCKCSSRDTAKCIWFPKSVRSLLPFGLPRFALIFFSTRFQARAPPYNELRRTAQSNGILWILCASKMQWIAVSRIWPKQRWRWRCCVGHHHLLLGVCAFGFAKELQLEQKSGIGNSDSHTAHTQLARLTNRGDGWNLVKMSQWFLDRCYEERYPLPYEHTNPAARANYVKNRFFSNIYENLIGRHRRLLTSDFMADMNRKSEMHWSVDIDHL